MTGTAPEPDREAERRRRAEFRAYVRRHHPDVGGDPDEFAAGLARFDRAGRERPAEQPPGEPDRFDAPVVFVARRGGLAGAVARIRNWRRRRRRPPRVS
ncbi:hypothetical protein [Qaidamihabitans albus]|uniref:hypothetical protein n=1 Tax=Qaidamihabitans albus TaxID=2795733 RepID=UPI0018F1F158|nr:hypothetical protein [Qaidamihabitans albus]